MADLDKIVEELSGLTILEAADLKKRLEDAWGVEAAVGGGMMMMAPGAGAADAEPEEEKTEFDVILVSYGPKKINVIKAIRTFTDLGLKEAKQLVESADNDGETAIVLEEVSKDSADEAKATLEEAGAVVEIK